MLEVPDFLLKMLEEQYGKEYTEKILNGYKARRKVTLRVNTIKSNMQEIEDIFSKNNIQFKEIPWYKDGLLIENAIEDDIRKLNIYEEGKIYLQSLSSMLPPIILEPKEKEDILDMAAAPGGKTTEIAAISNNMAHITACEINKIRIEKLKYNVEKQGAKSVYIMPKDSRQIDDFFRFDKILLDSPCSGSGTLNLNDNNIEKYFTENLIKKSVKTQETLIRKAIKILKPGGELVYSTCSILKQENEEIVNKILNFPNTEIEPIDFENMDIIPKLPVTIPGTLCVCPTEEYEGFFVAKIRKKSIN